MTTSNSKLGASLDGPLKTQLVVSDCSSVIHPIGKWTDTMLQPFAIDQPLYHHDSFQLIDILSPIRVSKQMRLVTCDAVVMYVNIPTDTAMRVISEYLRHNETKRRFDHYDAETLIGALEIVMRNNNFIKLSINVAEWTAFEDEVNSIDGLTWEFTESVDFMDITVSIAGNRLRTTLYEKPMALYIYIPPRSAHPPGILTGHVYSEVICDYIVFA
ncbi:hypothetical protein THAOC_37444 [Thalassiosira oceanica]|uniref:Uncharacterized protein n=1 Tax=Thalassiosira oceanica TaxID=159749 RepID=K0R5Z9_THAOC|nr:hypothetical protein THAOC_37444 [Thalassiosira oceanica]|eukprot:EJK44051.1 hypothetical protein THAOC_37444 [Thalassiosira oceanica]